MAVNRPMLRPTKILFWLVSYQDCKRSSKCSQSFRRSVSCNGEESATPTLTRKSARLFVAFPLLPQRSFEMLAPDTSSCWRSIHTRSIEALKSAGDCWLSKDFTVVSKSSAATNSALHWRRSSLWKIDTRNLSTLYSCYERQEGTDAKDAEGLGDSDSKRRGRTARPRKARAVKEALNAQQPEAVASPTSASHRRGGYTAKRTRSGSPEDA